MNDPDRYDTGDAGHGHGPADDGQTANWVPAPRHPGAAPPPLDSPSLDSPPLDSPSLDSPPLSAPPLDSPQPASGGPPPGPSFDGGDWRQPLFPVRPAWPPAAPDDWSPAPVPAPPDTRPAPFPQGGPPPGPALSLGGWRPEEHPTSFSQPQYSAPPPGPDLDPGGWAPGPPPGSATGSAGPWTGYREGWFRRLLARLRGQRRRA